MASQSSKTSPKKPKLVRDSFTIPKTEFAAIDKLKTRAIALGSSVKKSELLRAGLMVLQDLNDAAYKAALAAVPTLKTGRPTVADKPQTHKPAAKPAAKKRAKPTAPVAAQPAAKVAPQPVAQPVARKVAAKKATPAPKPAAKRPVTRRAAPTKKTA